MFEDRHPLLILNYFTDKVNCHLLHLGKPSLRNLSKAIARIGTHILGFQNLFSTWHNIGRERMEPIPARSRVPELTLEGLKWRSVRDGQPGQWDWHGQRKGGGSRQAQLGAWGLRDSERGGQGPGNNPCQGPGGTCHNQPQILRGKALGLYVLPSRTIMGGMNSARPLKYSAMYLGGGSWGQWDQFQALAIISTNHKVTLQG